MILITQSGDRAVNMNYIREVFVYTEGRETKRYAVIAIHDYNGWDGRIVLGEYSTPERTKNVFDWLAYAWAAESQELNYSMPKE